MSTTVQERDAAVTPIMPVPTPGEVRAVPAQPGLPASAPMPGAPTTSLQTAACTPAAIMGLGTRALATALVVHSAPPGYLRGALASLNGDAAR